MVINRVRISLKELFFSIILVVPLFPDTNYQYILFLFILLYLLIEKPSISFKSYCIVDKIPLFFLALWLWGIIVGIIRGNKLSYIFSNFAGIAIYSIYFFLVNKEINYNRLYKIIVSCSVIASLELLFVFFLKSRGVHVIWPLNNIIYNTWTNSVYADISVLPFVLLAKSLWCLFRPRRNGFSSKRIVNLFQFILATAATIYISDSGGILLGYISIIGIIIFISPIAHKKNSRYLVLSVFFFLLIVIAIVYYEIKTGLFLSIFAESSSGNDKRFEQFSMVFERFRIFGTGLGSEFTYKYNGRVITGYGIEISYLNIIDKFGILGIPMIFMFVVSYITPIVNLAKNRGIDVYNVILIGLMSYFFIAVGNPVLFSPYNIMLHLICLLFLRKQELNSINLNCFAILHPENAVSK